MKATLEIEFIGADSYRFLAGLNRQFSILLGPTEGAKLFPRPTGKPWVAEVGGNDPRYGTKRTFLRANYDYSRSNSKGSRGVYLWYILESGKLYEVYKLVSWKNDVRYFCAVTEKGDIYVLEDEEAKEWLSALSESTS